MQIQFLVLFSLVFVIAACGGGGSGGGGANGPDSDGDGVPDQIDEFPDDPTRATTEENAFRLLSQATYGPTMADINYVVKKGSVAWVDEQLDAPSAYDHENDAHLTHVQRTIEIAQLVRRNEDYFTEKVDNGVPTGSFIFNSQADNLIQKNQLAAWIENALGGQPDYPRHGSDQLRQRVAYALSQILVASSNDPILGRRSEALAEYADILTRNAFGNFRNLIREVTTSPAMGVYLSHRGNRKTTIENVPDENFSRELMQLFTIGLYQLNLDGSPDRDNNPLSYPDSGNNLVPSYTQQDVVELAKVMTGWNLQDLAFWSHFRFAKFGDYLGSMKFFPEQHEDESYAGGDGRVTILGETIDLAAIDRDGNPSGLDAALDVIFNHQNVGPFISSNLIRRLVTSNPSSAYVARITRVFNDNGAGIRGDLKSVVRAILLDEEARGDDFTLDSFGKVREPYLAFTHLLRAFDSQPFDGWEAIGGGEMEGVYWFSGLYSKISQGPLRANSVFNFYSDSYVPVDDYFINSQIVAPELQIQSSPVLLNYANAVGDVVDNQADLILHLIETYGGNGYNRDFYPKLNLQPALDVFERGIDGDSDGDFSNIEANRAAGVDALLDYLDLLLLGNTMEDKFRAALRHYLLDGSALDFKRFDDENMPEVALATQIVNEAIYFIATSSSYLVQK